MALDFEIIKTEDITKLVIVDSSDWTGLTGSKVDVLLPGCTEPETVELTRNQVNTYTMEDLNIEGDRLPDGLFEITLRDDSSSVTKKVMYLRSAYLTTEMFRNISSNIDTEEGFSKSVMDMNSVSLYIEAANVMAREEDALKAQYFYDQARTKLDNILNCK
jgi:hypothetical protein